MANDPVNTSLLDIKLNQIQEKYASKRQTLNLGTENESDSIEDIRKKYAKGSRSNLGSLAKSSLFRSKENVSNFLTGQVNPNRQAEADAAAGFSAADRQALNDQQNSIINSIAQGRINLDEGNTLRGLADFGTAALDTLRIAPELAADSAGSLVEGAAGVALTALPEVASSAAGIGLLGKKAKNIKDTLSNVAEDVKEAEERIKAGKKVNPVQKALARTAKATSQTSVMTASVLQEMKEDYVEENGELPSAEYWAVNAPIAVALNTFQLEIFKKALPSFKTKSKGKTDNNKSNEEGGKTENKEEVDKDKTKEKADYINTMVEVLDNIPKTYSRQVARTIYSKAKDVLKIAGAEGAQEYAQTWHEILATKMDGLTLSEIEKELASTDNQNQAIFGLLAGSAAGGVTKAAIEAPETALKLGIGTTAVATKKAGNFAKDKIAQADFSKLSEQEQADLIAEQENEEEIHNKFSEVKNAQIDLLDKAETVKDLNQEGQEILKDINKILKEEGITKEEFNTDKELFKAVTNKLQRTYKASIASSKVSLESTNLTRAVKARAKAAKNRTVETAQNIAESETGKAAIAIANKTSKALADSVRNFSSSTAAGVIEQGAKLTVDSSKTQVSNLASLAKETSVADLKVAAKAIKPQSIEGYNIVKKEIEAKTKATLNLTGQKEEVNKDNLSPVIKAVIEDGKVDNNSVNVVIRDLRKALKKNVIKDKESLVALEKALKIYKDSDNYKNKEKGSISAGNVKEFEQRLANTRKKLFLVDNVKETVTNKVQEFNVKKSKKTLAAINAKFVKNKKDLTPIVELGAIVSGQVEEYKDFNKDLIENGVDTKAKFVSFIKESAPDIAIFKQDDNFILDDIVNLFEDKLKEFEEDKLKKSKEDSNNSQDVDNFINDVEAGTATPVETLSEKEGNKLIDQLGLTKLKCGIK